MKLNKLQGFLLVVSVILLVLYFVFRKQDSAYLYAATFFICFSWVELIFFVRMKNEYDPRYTPAFFKFFGILLTGMLILWQKNWSLISFSSLPLLLYFGAKAYESYIIKQNTSHVSDTDNQP